MSVQLNWALCSHKAGDGHQVNPKVPERPATLKYLTEVVQSAEDAGFVNILVPTGTHCVDSWTTSASIAKDTRKIKFLVAFRPGLVSPVYAAQQANSLDYLTAGRLSLNVVAGTSEEDNKRYGYHVDHAERYKCSEEFVEVVMKLWEEKESFDFKGQYFDIRDSHIWPPRVTRPHPTIFISGSSDGAKRLAARFGDVHMYFAYEPEIVKKEIDETREISEEFPRERPLEFGVRHLVCVRETKEEARRAAEKVVEGSDLGNISHWADAVRKSKSVSQKRLNEMASRKSYWLTDTIWMGVNQVRAGASTMFVGTPDMVANQIKEYVEIGVNHFIMHGWPHKEEAEIFGREVMPLLKDIDLTILPEPANAVSAV